MAAVKVAERKIWVDDLAIPFISGEVHYWRLDPNSWHDALQRVREMGLQIVATYVCWDFHEIKPGQYDFIGKTDPRRNLIGFLDLLTEEDFWIILRPGPYIYSEWSNNGVPDHAAQCHRLSPEFRQRAEHYMQAVYDAVESYLATRGGRIIVWQSDNEIDPWPHLYTEQLGLGRRIGPFHTYLQEKYHDINSLNAAWGGTFENFEQVRAVTEMIPSDPPLMARYNDFRAFLHWYVHQVADWGIKTYRHLGVDVPILLNTYSGVGTQHMSNLEQIADIVGPDIYPSREFLHRGGDKEHRTILEVVRHTNSYSRLPYIAEYEAGIWHDWLGDVGYLPPNHYRLLCISALMAGSAGWNWYMLVNRDNWYQSPINEWGRTRPELFDVFRQITQLFHQIDPGTLERVSQIAVTFDPLQRATERPGQDLLHSLYQADVDYKFWDLSQGITEQPIAFYAGGRWLSKVGQERLLEYVENGGHLICIGDYPHLDEHMQPLNLLGFHAPLGIVSAAPFKMRWATDDDYQVESTWLYNYETTPGDPIILTRLPVEQIGSEELLLQFNIQAGAAYTIGYKERRGKGKITLMGVKPSPQLLLDILERQGMVVPSRSQIPGVTTTFCRRRNEIYLMAANVGNETKGVQIKLDPVIVPAGLWRVEDLLSKREVIEEIASNGLLTINIQHKDAIVLRLSPPAI